MDAKFSRQTMALIEKEPSLIGKIMIAQERGEIGYQKGILKMGSGLRLTPMRSDAVVSCDWHDTTVYINGPEIGMLTAEEIQSVVELLQSPYERFEAFSYANRAAWMHGKEFFLAEEIFFEKSAPPCHLIGNVFPAGGRHFRTVTPPEGYSLLLEHIKQKYYDPSSIKEEGYAVKTINGGVRWQGRRQQVSADVTINGVSMGIRIIASDVGGNAENYGRFETRLHKEVKQDEAHGFFSVSIPFDIETILLNLARELHAVYRP